MGKKQKTMKIIDKYLINNLKKYRLNSQIKKKIVNLTFNIFFLPRI